MQDPIPSQPAPFVSRHNTTKSRPHAVPRPAYPSSMPVANISQANLLASILANLPAAIQTPFPPFIAPPVLQPISSMPRPSSTALIASPSPSPSPLPSPSSSSSHNSLRKTSTLRRRTPATHYPPPTLHRSFPPRNPLDSPTSPTSPLTPFTIPPPPLPTIHALPTLTPRHRSLTPPEDRKPITRRWVDVKKGILKSGGLGGFDSRVAKDRGGRDKVGTMVRRDTGQRMVGREDGDRGEGGKKVRWEGEAGTEASEQLWREMRDGWRWV